MQIRQVVPVVILLIANPPQLPAQGDGSQYSLLGTTLQYWGDENLNAELELSADQIRKIMEVRQRIRDEAFTKTSMELRNSPGAWSKQVDAICTEVLKPEQLKRLKQLAYHDLFRFNLLSGGIPSRIGGDDVPIFTFKNHLKQHPEFKDAIGITAEQEKLLNSTMGFGKRDVVVISLTLEQRQKWRDFVGPPPLVPLRLQFDPRRPSLWNRHPLLEPFFRNGENRHFPLNQKQVARIKEIQKAWSSEIQNLSQLSMEKIVAALPESTRRIDGMLRELLGDDGFKRIRQFHIQTLQMTESAFPFDPELARLLGLSAKQLQDAERLRTERHTAIMAVASAEASAPDCIKKLKELDAKYAERRIEILDVDQRKKYAEAVGEPFGLLRTGAVAPASFGGNDRFGQFITELGYLTQREVIAELKMADAQIEQGSSAWQRFKEFALTAVARSATKYQELSAFCERELTAILTPEQLNRLREIALQARTSGPRFRGIQWPAVSYPGVAKEIGFTAEQRRRLDIIGSEDAVLTAEQKSKLKELQGKSMATLPMVPPEPSPSPFRKQTPRWMTFIERVDIVESLALNVKQYDGLLAAGAKFAEASAKAASIPIAERTRALDDAEAAYVKQLSESLTGQQLDRLRQLWWQGRAADSLADTLLVVEVRRALSLSHDQLQRIHDIVWEELERHRQIGLRIIPGKTDYQSLRDFADGRLRSLLSEGQRKSWNDMLGKPLASIDKKPFADPAMGWWRRD